VLPDVAAILRGLARQSHPVFRRSVGLKMPDFARYGAAMRPSAGGWQGRPGAVDRPLVDL